MWFLRNNLKPIMIIFELKPRRLMARVRYFNNDLHNYVIQYIFLAHKTFCFNNFHMFSYKSLQSRTCHIFLDSSFSNISSQAIHLGILEEEQWFQHWDQGIDSLNNKYPIQKRYCHNKHHHSNCIQNCCFQHPKISQFFRKRNKFLFGIIFQCRDLFVIIIEKHE